MGNVRMRHPNREDTVEVTERAFDVIWKKKGWKLVNPFSETGEFLEADFNSETDSDGGSWEEPDPDPPTTRIPTLESMEEDELREVAEELGIEGHDVLTANELRSLIGNTPEFYDNPADWPDA